jgi:hypothetical protein
MFKILIFFSVSRTRVQSLAGRCGQGRQVPQVRLNRVSRVKTSLCCGSAFVFCGSGVRNPRTKWITAAKVEVKLMKMIWFIAKFCIFYESFVEKQSWIFWLPMFISYFVKFAKKLEMKRKKLIETKMTEFHCKINFYCLNVLKLICKLYFFWKCYSEFAK